MDRDEKFKGRTYGKRRYHTVTVVETRTYVVPIGGIGVSMCRDLMDPTIPLNYFGPGDDRKRVIFTDLNKEGS